jgi:hypothetical protein
VLARETAAGSKVLLAIAPEGNLGLLEQRRDGFGAASRCRNWGSYGLYLVSGG